jgi:hypothetical protein
MYGRSRRLHGRAAVDGPAGHVEHAPEDLLADGDRDGPSRPAGPQAPGEALRGLHRDASRDAVSRVEEAFHEELGPVRLVDLDGVQDGGHRAPFEAKIEDGAGDPHDRSDALAHVPAPFLVAERRGARDDLGYFAGNRRLPRPVVT